MKINRERKGKQDERNEKKEQERGVKNRLPIYIFILIKLVTRITIKIN